MPNNRDLSLLRLSFGCGSRLRYRLWSWFRLRASHELPLQPQSYVILPQRRMRMNVCFALFLRAQ